MSIPQSTPPYQRPPSSGNPPNSRSDSSQTPPAKKVQKVSDPVLQDVEAQKSFRMNKTITYVITTEKDQKTLFADVPEQVPSPVTDPHEGRQIDPRTLQTIRDQNFHAPPSFGSQPQDPEINEEIKYFEGHRRGNGDSRNARSNHRGDSGQFREGNYSDRSNYSRARDQSRNLDPRSYGDNRGNSSQSRGYRSTELSIEAPRRSGQASDLEILLPIRSAPSLGLSEGLEQLWKGFYIGLNSSEPEFVKIIQGMLESEGRKQLKAVCMMKAACEWIRWQSTFKLVEQDTQKFGVSKASPTASTKFPDYFGEILKGKVSEVTAVGDFYDYSSTDGYLDFWTTFGNSHFGGGILGEGNLMEETIVQHSPELAFVVAKEREKNYWGYIQHKERDTCSRRTRIPYNEVCKPDNVNCDKAGNGKPTPVLFLNALRTIKIPDAAYGSGIDDYKSDRLLEEIEVLSLPQGINYLAIAAPDISTRNGVFPNRWDPMVLKDIYNTLKAGIYLLSEQEDLSKIILHSGRFGCGAFKNHELAVYLLHRLVAQDTGITIKLHGYKDHQDQDETMSDGLYNLDNKIEVFNRVWNLLAPRLEGKTIEECIHYIYDHFKNLDGYGQEGQNLTEILQTIEPPKPGSSSVSGSTCVIS